MNDKLDISIMEEWEVIQENFFKFDYNMKLCIKDKIMQNSLYKNHWYQTTSGINKN